MSCRCEICLSPDDMGEIRLHEIVKCKKNRVSLVRQLLKAMDPNIRDGNGNTPLHLAASNENDNIETVKVLLKSGAEVSAVNNRMITPLLIAVKHSNAQIVEVLLQFGANVNAADTEGYTALDIAILNYSAGNQPNNSLIRRLIDTRMNVNPTEGIIQTPLLLAVAVSDTDIIRKILQAGGDVSVYNCNTETCLHIALRRPGHNRELIEELIKYGANVTFKDSWYKSPLDIAVENCIGNPSEGYRILKSLLKMAILVQPKISIEFDNAKLCTCLKEFGKACYNEVSRMGHVQLAEYTSLKDFALRGITCSVYSDSNIVNSIYNYGLYASLFESYAIYNDWIISHLPRTYLREVISYVKFFSTNRDYKVFTIVPDVVRKISDFLTCPDIVRLIKAFMPRYGFKFKVTCI